LCGRGGFSAPDSEIDISRFAIREKTNHKQMNGSGRLFADRLPLEPLSVCSLEVEHMNPHRLKNVSRLAYFKACEAAKKELHWYWGPSSYEVVNAERADRLYMAGERIAVKEEGR
jgi:hypothetical protein